jgi:hypothetical protein
VQFSKSTGQEGNQSMRSMILIAAAALAAVTIFGSSVSAAPIKQTLHGSYSPAKMERMCLDRGGQYHQDGGGYGCSSGCTSSQGEPSLCDINCKGSKCTGTTPG